MATTCGARAGFSRSLHDFERDRIIKKNSHNDTVIISVAYPSLGGFLKDYLDSLEKQSRSDFDLLIANDGMDGLDPMLAARKLSWQTIGVEGSVSSNRRTMICRAIEQGYKKIIFADCDDALWENKVEVVSSLLDRELIVVNDLDIIDSDGSRKEASYFSKRFDDASIIALSTLMTGNMMGLSNTAVRADALKVSPALSSGDSIAFDWYLWSTLLLDGSTAFFTAETFTKYRVYGNNTAGFPQPITEENVVKGVKVKHQHYGLMARLNSTYSELADEFDWLHEKMEDKGCRMAYIEALKKCEISNPIWWENIRTRSEVGLK